MEEKRPKVLALYQAVLQLLDAGADINALKVSDITDCAGIGKGTAYEYFKSKEEIIASALTYDLDKKIRAELVYLENCPRFAERIRRIFDWITTQHAEQKSFTRYLRLTTQICEVNAALLAAIKEKQQELGGGPVMLIEKICRQGKESGEIRSDIPAKAATIQVLADLTAFVMYLERRQETCELEPEWMKDFLCGGLIKSLA